MDKYFDTLDIIINDKACSDKPITPTCCNDIENHVISNETLLCKKCESTISNILDGPEWRFYGVNDTKSSDPTRCGMPLNQLLP